MIFHWRTRTGSDWWFSKIWQTRTGSVSILSDRDWTRIEKFHSPLISGSHQRWNRIRIHGVDCSWILRFFRTRIRTQSQKLVKKRNQIRGQFSISAVAGVCAVIS